MRKPQIERKHMVYAEDILYELMQHPDNMIYKFELRQIIAKVIEEKEISLYRVSAHPGYYGDDEGDIYD